MCIQSLMIYEYSYIIISQTYGTIHIRYICGNIFGFEISTLVFEFWNENDPVSLKFIYTASQCPLADSCFMLFLWLEVIQGDAASFFKQNLN